VIRSEARAAADTRNAGLKVLLFVFDRRFLAKSPGLWFSGLGMWDFGS
jgi:hypothetical protein